MSRFRLYEVGDDADGALEAAYHADFDVADEKAAGAFLSLRVMFLLMKRRLMVTSAS